MNGFLSTRAVPPPYNRESLGLVAAEKNLDQRGKISVIVNEEHIDGT